LAKLSFEQPASAPAHVALRRAIAQAGLDELALRRLLWLLNGHPTLIAHALVFRHVGLHLASETFSTGQLDWAGAWIADIPEWIRTCDWIWNHRIALSRIPGLGALDRQPGTTTGQVESIDDHPHIHHGVVRHGIVAALWNCHQSIRAYPPPEGETNSPSQQYFLLQRHILASYIDCRFRASSLDFYEHYADFLELPVAPLRTSSVSPAIRQFSFNEYAPLLRQLPIESSTIRFAEALEATQFRLTDFPFELHSQLLQHLAAIRRYFYRYWLMTHGWLPSQVTKDSWSGGGKRVPRPGYVHVGGAPGVYFQSKEDAPEDAEIVHLYAQTVHVDRDPEGDDDPDAAEMSGLAPMETMEEVFPLFDPDELNGKMLEIHHQRLAIEMQAQDLPFDYENLTPQEIHDVWSILERRIEAYLSTETSDDSVRQIAITSVMLKISLCFGQTLDIVRDLALSWQIEAPDGGTEIGGSERALVFASPIRGNWDQATLIGLRLPAIHPDYKTQRPAELDDIDRPYVARFVIPDLFEIGKQLIRCLNRHPPQGGRVFSLNLATVKRSARLILKQLDNERITPEKIALVVPNNVTSTTGDQSLTWLLTANGSRGNEPRTHYTRHPVSKLLRAYQCVARRLGRNLGKHVIPVDVQNLPNNIEAITTVGARFVVELREVRSWIHNLVEELSTRRPDRESPLVFSGYHNLYLLYTSIYQSLQTSLRSLTCPRALYDTWLRNAHRRGSIRASISDKDREFFERSRLGSIDTDLAKQYSYLLTHDNFVCSHPQIRRPAETFGLAHRPFFGLSAKLELVLFTPGLIAQALKTITGRAVPANFHRSFLRTELLARECPAEVVDAYLGHSNYGESSFSTYSSFDYRIFSDCLDVYLRQIREELGLKPIESRLVPWSKRVSNT